MIVCDAGFPIPSTAWRIDLAIVPDVPDLETVLQAIAQNFIAERVGYADVMPDHNAPLLAKVRRLFADAEFMTGQARDHTVGIGGEGESDRANGRFRSLGQHTALFRRRCARMVLQARRRRSRLLREKDEGLMPRIFDLAGREVERSQTVAGLRALKGSGQRATQTTAETAEETAAAEEAGLEMAICRGANVRQARAGSQRLFLTAALGFTQAVTADDMLRAAFAAIDAGADAVITARGYETVRALAAESIPVVGHLGFVPRKSTWTGGVRAVGKTAAEALGLWDRFRRLEDAGAFAAECELIPAAVMAEINQRTSLVTISLGSGGDADVIFLFASDICGTVETAASCACVGRPRESVQGHAGGEGQGVVRFSRRRHIGQLPRR